MTIPSSPIVRRQRLGTELRALRDAAHLTGKQVIAELGWRAQSKLTRIEKGLSRTDVGDIMDLLDLYHVEGAKRDKLIQIAREAADRRALWHAVAGIGDRQRSYAEFENGATQIRQYQQLLVPGLLQTPEYARIRVESVCGLYDVDLTTDAPARTARQQVLGREHPPTYETIIEEWALRRVVAPAKILREQLRYLLQMTELPNVTVRVAPMSHPVADFYAPHSSFSIYRFADPDDPELVTLETLTSDVHIRDEDEIAAYEKVYRWLQRATLSEEASHRLIATLAEDT